MTYVPLKVLQVQKQPLSTLRRTEPLAAFRERREAYARFPQEPKILLLEPYYPSEAAWGSAKVEQGYLPPLGTISIHRWLLEKGYDVHFLDTQFGDNTADSLKRLLQEEGYDLVGLPVFTPTAGHAFDTARLVRSALPDCVIVMGGVHVTARSAESLDECPECDFVIRREGEITLTELIESLKAKASDFSHIDGLTWRKDPETVVLNPDRTLVPDLDDLPVGMFGNLDLSRYVPHPTQYVKLPNYPLVTQRGCPYPCTYCEAHVALGKKLRVYSPERVIEELKILKYEKGARGLYFQDSTFTMHRRYVTELFERMIKEGLNDLYWSCTTRTDRVDPDLLALMREAGCRNIAYGIESGNQQSLDVIKKNITPERQEEAVGWTHAARITVSCSYIICLPGETEEMVHNTIQYAKRLASQIGMFYLPVPYPATELYQACKETGGIRETDNWNEYLAIDFDDPIYVNPLIGKERMKYWYKRAFWEYYTHPNVWMNNLKGLMWNGGVQRYLRGVNAVRALLMRNTGEFIKQSYRGFHGQGTPMDV